MEKSVTFLENLGFFLFHLFVIRVSGRPSFQVTKGKARLGFACELRLFKDDVLFLIDTKVIIKRETQLLSLRLVHKGAIWIVDNLDNVVSTQLANRF